MNRIDSTLVSSIAPHRHRSGFALIIVVSLLALLVMVLVSLATITRIEVGIGANSRKDAQAKQNARFALEIALAELQRHAGADNRVTAVSNLEFGLAPNGARFWTGVWNSGDNLGSSTWLVSGNENGALNYDPNSAIPNPISLVDLKSVSGATSLVIVNREDLVSESFPGLSGPQTVGRYAWWVGDEGVKASMALIDRREGVNYGPYSQDDLDGDGIQDGIELRRRLAQQVPTTHQSFQGLYGADIDRNPPVPPPDSADFGWDPAIGPNQDVAERVLSRSQLRFLTPENFENFGSLLKSRFHDWTTISSGVLASTNPTHQGLKRDLSQAPELLGPGFVAWADYESRLEVFPSSSSVSPRILDANDFRRRYHIRPPETIDPNSGQILSGISPVVSNLVIQFLFRRVDAGAGLTDVEIRCRAHVEMWNPYTSALVPPQELRLEISGFPAVSFGSGATTVGPFSLQDRTNSLTGGGSVMRLSLPFDTGDANPSSDRTTWLPGRVFNWRTSNHSGSGSASLPLRFGSKLLDRTNGWELASVEDLVLPAGALEISGSAASLQVELLSMSESTTVQLARFNTPMMPGSGTWSVSVADGASIDSTSDGWCLAFGFRLPQPGSNGSPAQTSWLAPTGKDPRSVNAAGSDLIPHAPGEFSPVAAVYHNDVRTNWDNSDGYQGLLLNRPTGGADLGAESDTPVFELPRSPILSLGMLQHLQVAGAPAFAVGNSWGAQISPPTTGGYSGGTIGSWWDRFFFSGSVPAGAGHSGVDDRASSSSADPLPFVHFRTFDSTGTPVTVGQLHGAAGFSSRHLMLNGAFNINSTSIDAWEAVLRSVRPGARDEWQVGEIDLVTGNAEDVGGASATVVTSLTDSTQGSIAPANRPSGFFRFSQTAQECFDSKEAGAVSGFNRTPYRQGFRGGDNGTGVAAGRNLSSQDLRRLAEEIVFRIRQHGPFRSLEEFVSVVPSGSRSALELAIDDSEVNLGRPFMSAFYLTQADILTAIGPFLQCRSDTFTIRAYGETVNPVTQEVEARAWCEATVQRTPTKVDGTDPTTAATGFGRRFVITSFRWLSPDDI